MVNGETIRNASSGIGDPYWYEWSVGLSYALDMLSPDSDIEYVVLQSSDFQGLDDVLIKHKSGGMTGVQIKHTRENDTFTYADLVLPANENEPSLLSKLCKDWKRAMNDEKHRDCSVVLFTNREVGKRESVSQKGTDDEFHRPPLDKFWALIKVQLPKAQTLQEIAISPEWEPAWQRVQKELRILDSEEEKVCFMKNLDLKTDQADLEQLIEDIQEKLAKYFHASSRVVQQLDQRLCSALRKWVTTCRENEQITREDLYTALSVSQDSFAGDHDLPVCEPFFESRRSLIDQIERILKFREYPVVFLAGEPGAGKTNIINELSNKPDSVITLRFHAFKPINPGDLYISGDAGISDPRSFWGDLLIQIRSLLVGHLSENNVPVCNGLIESIDKLREEVIRLAEAYARLHDKISVIAVDGIDHSARAGITNSFLRTLIPPEAVPPNVCFIIAGQPLLGDDSYPDWLADSDAVKRIDIPIIERGDIEQLLNCANIELLDCDNSRIAEVIYYYTKGNTLSSVFAVYECKHVNQISDLEDKLNSSNISSGIKSYYEYIWKLAKGHLPSDYYYLDTRLAAALCLLNRRITPRTMCDIYKEYNQPEIVWRRLLVDLYPIVVYEEGGFRVLHNDTRVYLESYIRKDAIEFRSICQQLAVYLFRYSDDREATHELGFKFLSMARQEAHFIKYYTYEYVMEAIRVKRPISEIIEQMEMVSSSIGEEYDFFELLAFSLAVTTLNQYKQSLQWLDMEHVEKYRLPVLLPCEREVAEIRRISKRNINNMLRETNILIEENRQDIARRVIDRWIRDMTPYSLIEQLSINDGKDFSMDYIKDKEITSILKRLGSIDYVLGREYLNKEESTNCRYVYGHWYSGWLETARSRNIADCHKMIVEKKAECFYADVEKCLFDLLDSENYEQAVQFVERCLVDRFSEFAKVHLACWSILHERADLCKDVIIDILNKGLKFLGSNSGDRDDDKIFLRCAEIVFVLSVYNKISVDEFDGIVLESLRISRGFSVSKEDRGYFSANNLLVSTIVLAQIIADIQCGRAIENLSEGIENIVSTVFDDRDSLGCAEINGGNVKKMLLEGVISIDDRFPQSIAKKLEGMIVYGAGSTNNLSCLQIWWKYLRDNCYFEDLHKIFERWLSPDTGRAWCGDLSETHGIAGKFIPLANGLGWDSEIDKLNCILDCAKIGYSGHKDYSLYDAFNWFETLEFSEDIWGSIGLRLLNVSEQASEIGDNRAAVSIEGAVAEAVGHSGVNAIGEFLHTIDPHDWNECALIIDAVIAGIEKEQLSEKDILSIWETMISVINVDMSFPEHDSDNSIRIVYLVDVKRALVERIKTWESSSQLLERMHQLAPKEYDMKYCQEAIMFDIPKRWYDKEGRNKQADEFKEKVYAMDCDGAFASLKEIVLSKSTYRWDYGIGFVEKIDENSRDISSYLDELLALILDTRDWACWEADGVYRLIGKIFSRMNSVQRLMLLKDINNHYQKIHYPENTYILCDDYNRFTFWHSASMAQNDKKKVIETMIDMHIKWVSAFGLLSFKDRYVGCEHAMQDYSWPKLCDELKGHSTKS